MKKISRKLHNITVLIFGAILGLTVIVFNKKLLIEILGVFDSIFFISLFFLIALFTQIILHELGHLIFGLASGYSFVSFRVGSLTLVKEDKLYKIKRYSIPGTAGQCLMAPPQGSKTEYPFRLYNWGGIIINAVFSIIGLIVFFNSSGLLRLFSMLFFHMGFLAILMNAIPVEGANTDGTNLLDLEVSLDARKALYNMLEINRLYQEGFRPREIPHDLTEISQYEDLKNSMVASMESNSYSKMLDKGDYVGSFNSLKNSLNNPYVSDIMKLILEFEYSTVGMLIGNNDIATGNMEKKQFAKLSKYNKLKEITRFNYIYNLLVTKDDENAKKHLENFNKIIANDPFSGDVKFNEDLIKRAQNIVAAEENIVRLDSVDSTNNYAKSLMTDELVNGFTVIAKNQVSGRGQRDNRFFSPTGGLYISIILKPSISLDDSKYLSAFTAIHVHDAIREVFKKNIKIKWINDLIYMDKKIGGILTETKVSTDNQLEYAVIGIGINLYNMAIVPKELQDIYGTLEQSDYQLYMKDFEYNIIERIRTLSVKQNVSEMINRYNELLYKKNDIVKLKIKDNTIDGKLLGVNTDLSIEVLIEDVIVSYSSEEAKLLFP